MSSTATSATTTTTTALRWRARMVKDAIHPDLGTADDSRIHLSMHDMNSSGDGSDIIEKGSGGVPFLQEDHNHIKGNSKAAAHSNGTTATGFFPFPRYRHYTSSGSSVGTTSNKTNHNTDRSTTNDYNYYSANYGSCCCSWANFAIRCLSLAAIFTTITALDYWRSWYMAILCCLTVILSVWMWYQLERLNALRSIRYQVRKTRQTTNRLSIQAEALWRQVERAEQDFSHLQHVAVQMKQVTQSSGKSVTQLQHLSEEWASTSEAMQQALHQQMQQEVLRLVLDSDADGNFALNDAEWKRLQLRINHGVPGVQLEILPPNSGQQQQQNLLQEEDDEEGVDSFYKKKKNMVGVIEVLRLLQQAQAQLQHKSHKRKQQQHHHHTTTTPQHGRSSAAGSTATTAMSETIVHLTSQIRLRLNPQGALLKKRPMNQ